MPAATGGARFTLELVTLLDPNAGRGSPARPGPYRLRLALKCLLCGYGLRCVRVAEVKADALATGASDGVPAPAAV